MSFIPDWTPHGVLPPVGSDPTSPDYRSPYLVSVVDFVMRFGSTPARRNIVSGFLSFRAALASVGLVNGFQWIDGSFPLNADEVTTVIAQATYWNNLWSHRRDGRWKGYVQIDLSPADDATARANLDARMSGEDT